nr:MAG TPA: endonuclease [Caudoviricetes sp.]
MISNKVNLIHISHKIQLKPNNKAKTHFKKAFGCARLAYNWALSKWQENYKLGIKSNWVDLLNEFNKIKKTQFPYVSDVSTYATLQPFRDLDKAMQKFYRDLKQGKVSYPRFKKKKDNSGSFYIPGQTTEVKNEKYLWVPKLGLVKMTESLKFKGKINSVTISQKGDKFYASFSMEITEDEYLRTHKAPKQNDLAVGIDLGIKTFLTLSNGLQIEAPKPLNKLNRLLIRRQRQLDKKLHPRTKAEALKGVQKSNNYNKASLKLNKVHQMVANIRKDYLHKLTSSLVANIQNFAIEDLNVNGMKQNHTLAKCLSDISFFEFRQMLQYKSEFNHRKVHVVDRFYPSSKTCSNCGNIKKDLTLNDRTYQCEACGLVIDRDYNASLNLLSQIEQDKSVRSVRPEFTPADLTALVSDLEINHILTSKIETGIHHIKATL